MPDTLLRVVVALRGTLRILDLSEARVTDGGLEALAGSPATARLTALRVNPVGSQAVVELLTDGKTFPNLSDLRLGASPIGLPDRERVARQLGVTLPRVADGVVGKRGFRIH